MNYNNPSSNNSNLHSRGTSQINSPTHNFMVPANAVLSPNFLERNPNVSQGDRYGPQYGFAQSGSFAPGQQHSQSHAQSHAQSNAQHAHASNLSQAFAPYPVHPAAAFDPPSHRASSDLYQISCSSKMVVDMLYTHVVSPADLLMILKSGYEGSSGPELPEENETDFFGHLLDDSDNEFGLEFGQEEGQEIEQPSTQQSLRAPSQISQLMVTSQVSENAVPLHQQSSRQSSRQTPLDWAEEDPVTDRTEITTGRSDNYINTPPKTSNHSPDSASRLQGSGSHSQSQSQSQMAARGTHETNNPVSTLEYDVSRNTQESSIRAREEPDNSERRASSDESAGSAVGASRDAREVAAVLSRLWGRGQACAKCVRNCNILQTSSSSDQSSSPSAFSPLPSAAGRENKEKDKDNSKSKSSQGQGEPQPQNSNVSSSNSDDVVSKLLRSTPARIGVGNCQDNLICTVCSEYVIAKSTAE